MYYGDKKILSVVKVEDKKFKAMVQRSITSVGDALEGMTSIGAYAFAGCTRLNSLTIPSSVTQIGGYALRIGGTLGMFSRITMKSTTPPTIESTTFSSSLTLRIIVPKGCGETYKNATNWANFAGRIEEEAE